MLILLCQFGVLVGVNYEDNLQVNLDVSQRALIGVGCLYDESGNRIVIFIFIVQNLKLS